MPTWRVKIAGACALFSWLNGPGWAPNRAEAETAPKPNRVTAGYFGESVTNPGASIGYEVAFYYRRPHELLGGAHIGGYNSADPSYYGLFIYLEGGYRLNFSIGFFMEARVGLGYINTTRSGGLLMLPDGGMAPAPNINGNYLMPIGLVGLGWDLLPRTRVPLSLFADVGGLGRYSQSEAFGGGLVLTAGVGYQFGTGRPRPAESAVPSPPVPVAPPYLDDRPPGVSETFAPASSGAAEPAPPAAPAAPSVQPVPPQLPPPPTVPGAP